MKKVMLGFTFVVGIALIVCAECTDKVINSSSDDAANPGNCATNDTTTACVYHLMQPAKPECTSGGNGLCVTGTNTVDVVTTTWNGTCNGSGGCHGGTQATEPATTNTVSTITLGTCGG